MLLVGHLLMLSLLAATVTAATAAPTQGYLKSVKYQFYHNNAQW
jgi:hypothetical protein